ncbi:hypothetical protein L227DRAFT_333541 [Lentinus tigrinus ALCF2SS1-6]|uniref:Uncharacterized protein n=1 Tax=Lentinus tigrinus ALCF2SS1-6 TaxID=1328759 RepID=A0A5C2RUT9_9APHY|nr:hypothetical protein L227DRAFT_333541 [Lentinus tigrinus ALCF2SS1-6]
MLRLASYYTPDYSFSHHVPSILCLPPSSLSLPFTLNLRSLVAPSKLDGFASNFAHRPKTTQRMGCPNSSTFHRSVGELWRHLPGPAHPQLFSTSTHHISSPSHPIGAKCGTNILRYPVHASAKFRGDMPRRALRTALSRLSRRFRHLLGPYPPQRTQFCTSRHANSDA